ncbi:MAG: hypothetical protein N2323_05350 [candidate division WOR-3 bacterium]|nr:hypothetical protein [candidate division WOR-3 bacterium]MCX7837366.1 hypothetical protein [candidate division WOR-3 bacterium]MDW8114115.1 hypothetical protein [candidate division WOR-3 bacterium]
MVCEIAILGLSLKPLDYLLSENLLKEIEIGSLVKIPLKKKEHYGVVVGFKKGNGEKELKEIKEVIIKNFLPKKLLRLIKITARYYFLEISDLLNYILPKGLIKDLLKEKEEFPCEEEKREKRIIPYLFWQYPDFALFQKTFNIILKLIKENKSVLLIFPTFEILNNYYQFFLENFPNKEINLYQYHYQIKRKEEINIWKDIRRGKSCILFSIRKGIFLPFLNLGGVFLFFEEMPLYKEWERKIHFDVRKLSFFRSFLENIPLFIFTPSPSIELFYQILKKRIKVLRKDKTYLETKRIIIVKKEKDKILTAPLKKFLFYLREKEKAFLLMPEKSYSKIIYCEDCGYFPKCPSCQIALSYFKNPPRLECPYCRYQTIFDICPNCQSENFYYKYFGKEKLIEELEKEDFPNKKNIEIGGFLDSLSLTSPLDFSAILDYENLFSYFGFLSEERVLQIFIYLLNKIKKNGFLLVQKRDKKEDEFLRFLKRKEIEKIYFLILKKRKELMYPPFSKLLLIKVIGEREKLTKSIYKIKENIKKLLNEKIKDSNEVKILGPLQKIKRKRKKRVYQFLLKIPKNIRIHNYLNLEDFKKIIIKNLEIEIDFEPIDI